jgi:hypothetical protein
MYLRGQDMLSSILTIIVVLCIGALIGAGILVAVLWISVEKD